MEKGKARKIEGAGEKEPKEKKEILEKPGVIEREVKKERERILEEFEEKVPLDSETREKIERILEKEKERLFIEFAKKYFKENQELFASKGYNVRSENEGYILRAVNEVEGWEALRSDERYKELNQEIEEISLCVKESQRGRLYIDSAHLILNRIYHQRERLEREKKLAQKKGDEAQAKALESQIKEINDAMEKLLSHILGKDIRKEAESSEKPLEEKEIYLKRREEEELKKITSYLDFLGLFRDVERKGIFKKVYVLKKRDTGEKVGEFKDIEESIEFLDRKAREKIRQDAEKEWESLKNQREKRIEEKIEKIVREYALSPEKAIEGIKSVYQRVRERLEKEALRLVEMPKKVERPEVFEGREVDLREILDKFFELFRSIEKFEKLKWEELTREIEKSLKEIIERTFPKVEEILPKEAKPEEIKEDAREKFLKEASKEILGKVIKWLRRYINWERFVTLLFEVLFLWQWRMIAWAAEEGGFKREAKDIRRRIAEIQKRLLPPEEEEE